MNVRNQARTASGAPRVKTRRLSGGKSRNYGVGGTIGIGIFIGILAAFCIIPLLMSVGMAFKPIPELFYYPPKILPRHPTLANFSMLFQLMKSSWVPFSRYIFNTVFLTLAATFGHVLLASMAAFPLAKCLFPGKRVCNSLVLYALMFIPAVNDIANYLTISWLGWLDTYLAVIVPFLGSTLGLFLIRNYMATIPDSLLEAAKIDGCTEFQMYRIIAMPLSRPAWLTVIILMFQQMWNASPTTYIYREELKTLPYALGQIVSGGLVRVGAGQAAAVLMLAVPAFVFIMNQTKIIETMTTSGLKE